MPRKPPVNITKVYEDHNDKLRGYIARRVSFAEDAEDILQTVFYNLSRIDQSEDPIGNITSWLYTASRNLIIDRGRKKREERMPQSRKGDDTDDFESDLTDILYFDASTPETEYIKLLVWEKLEETLDEMPQEQRSVFELTVLEGLSFKEISKAAGISVNTLLSRKRLAVLRLRDAMRPLYEQLMGEE